MLDKSLVGMALVAHLPVPIMEIVAGATTQGPTTLAQRRDSLPPRIQTMIAATALEIWGDPVLVEPFKSFNGDPTNEADFLAFVSTYLPAKGVQLNGSERDALYRALQNGDRSGALGIIRDAATRSFPIWVQSQIMMLETL